MVGRYGVCRAGRRQRDSRMAKRTFGTAPQQTRDAEPRTDSSCQPPPPPGVSRGDRVMYYVVSQPPPDPWIAAEEPCAQRDDPRELYGAAGARRIGAQLASHDIM
eukprot:1194373-Prorocentrum_minimum.AAC.5